jgi:hypothetical protein
MKKTTTEMTIEQVAEFRSCLTCAHRRPHAPSVRNGELRYSVFYCGASWNTGKSTLGPQEVCEHWQRVTVGDG